MYVAVKGGETAIAHSLDLIADKRRGDRDVAELSLEQIDQQLGLAVDRVMTEGSCYDRALAALAIKQARGDLVEAIFLLRAYRTTLPRFGNSLPLETTSMVVERRISGTFKDVPGGQVLGPTYDYTHRLLDFSLAASGERPHAPTAPVDSAQAVPRVGDILERDGLLEPPPQGETSDDLTRQPLTLPASPRARFCSLSGREAGRVSGWRVRSSDVSPCGGGPFGGGSSRPSRSRMSPTRGMAWALSTGAVGACGRLPDAASEKSSSRWV